MSAFYRWRRQITIWIVTSVFIAVYLCDCSDAAIANRRTSNNEEEYIEPDHHVVKRHYYDKKYGDGSLKKFFFMLKIILTIFGKH